MDRAFVRHGVHSSVTPGVVLIFFHKGVLTYAIWGSTERKRGYNHSRNKVSQAVVERLLPPAHGSEFRGDGPVIF